MGGCKKLREKTVAWSRGEMTGWTSMVRTEMISGHCNFSGICPLSPKFYVSLNFITY